MKSFSPDVAVLRNSATAWTFQEWGLKPAAVYRGRFSAESTGGSGDAHELADYGFITTSLSFTDGSAADLPPNDYGSSGATIDLGTPGSAVTNAASDKFQSPSIFADPTGFRTAAQCLGQSKPPRMFVIEFCAAFTTASNNETATCIGLCEDGGSVIVANDAFATIYSNGTNIKLRSGAANETVISALATVTTPLFYRIEVDRIDQIIRWFSSTDGFTWTARGTLALEADELPVAFGFGVVSAGSNVLEVYGDVYAGYE